MSWGAVVAAELRARQIAAIAGITVPPGRRLLAAFAGGINRDQVQVIDRQPTF